LYGRTCISSNYLCKLVASGEDLRKLQGEKEGAHPDSMQTQKLRKMLDQVNKSYFEVFAM